MVDGNCERVIAPAVRHEKPALLSLTLLGIDLPTPGCVRAGLLTDVASCSLTRHTGSPVHCGQGCTLQKLGHSGGMAALIRQWLRTRGRQQQHRNRPPDCNQWAGRTVTSSGNGLAEDIPQYTGHSIATGHKGRLKNLKPRWAQLNSFA